MPPDHVVEVSSYVAALDHGLSRARGLPARESKRRNRVFVYDGYLDILSEGTEPL